MAAMQPAGSSHPLSRHARLVEEEAEYVIDLAVPDFAEHELVVETLGPVVTVRGEQQEGRDDAVPFRLHERLVESFRLPDDADPARLSAAYGHGLLELRAPRVPLERVVVQIGSDAWRSRPDAEAV